MTLGDVRTRFRLMMGGQAPESVISNTELDYLINDGLKDVALRSECLEASNDQDVTASTQEYTVPNDCVKITSVYYGGSGDWEKLTEVTPDWLANEIDSEWLNDSGTTYGYYKRGNKIGLYKIPGSSEAGTNYLRIYYIQQPTELTLTTDVPFSGYYHLYLYHDLIVLYTMYKMKQILGLWEQAKTIETEYMLKCAEMKKEIHKLDDFQQVIRPYYKGGPASSLKQNPLDQ